MNGFLFDTNVLLDIATADPVWLPWSEGQFRSAAAVMILAGIGVAQDGGEPGPHRADRSTFYALPVNFLARARGN
jgi:hypothetical protein